VTTSKPGEDGVSEYRVFETEEFVRCLRKLPEADAGFIQARLRSAVYPRLPEIPFVGPHIKRLRGYTPETWRYRIGSYRELPHVDQHDKVVFPLTIGKRADAYR
jgi:mRNA interferase RelE/StbE